MVERPLQAGAPGLKSAGDEFECVWGIGFSRPALPASGDELAGIDLAVAGRQTRSNAPTSAVRHMHRHLGRCVLPRRVRRWSPLHRSPYGIFG